jgi:peptide/nickel transport system permease protein
MGPHRGTSGAGAGVSAAPASRRLRSGSAAIASRLLGRRSSSFASFIVQRLVSFVLLTFGITLIAFCLTHLVPADPAVAALGDTASNDQALVHAFRERYGLDKPLPQQYGIYVWRLLHGDLGRSSQTSNSVWHDLSNAIPASIELALLGIVITVVVGIFLGTVSAIYYGRMLDQVIRVVSLVGVSVPSFWLALVAFYIFFYKLGWVPPGGRLDAATLSPPKVTGLYTVDAALAGQWSTCWQALQHLILPALVLAAYTGSFMVRFTRSAVLEVVNTEYVRVARAKGLPARTVIFTYILRGALPSILTLAGLSFASLLSGTVLVEQIFSWPGIGQYAYVSATTLDLNAVMGVSLFIALVYLVINLFVDILYGIVDPRIRLGRR